MTTGTGRFLRSATLALLLSAGSAAAEAPAENVPAEEKISSFLLDNEMEVVVSRIYQSLVVKDGTASSAGAYFDGAKLDDGSFTVFGAPRGTAELDEVEAAIDAEIAGIVKDGVSEEELKAAKDRFLRSMIFARDSQASMANIYGASLATGSTIEDIESWPDRIKNVTPADVQRAAARYLRASNPVTGYLLPAQPIQN